MARNSSSSAQGESLVRLASLARTVPSVTGAVAVTRRRVRVSHEPAPRGSEPLEPAPRSPASRSPALLEPAHPSPSHPPAMVIAPAAEPAPGSPTTLAGALHRAATVAAGKGTVYLAPDGTERFQSYPELLAQARRVLGGLQAAGLRPGDSALFQFGDNRDYVTAFWACILGGIVPTPVALGPDYERHSAISRKLRNAWHLLGRPAILTGHGSMPEVSRLGKLWDEPRVTVLDLDALAASEPSTNEHDAAPADPVLHLLTSGSTGVPKCVRHTNASVAARTYGVASACGYGPDDITVNWMPLDHVAIVMYNVRDVFLGCGHVNVPVGMFLADPLNWMTWIDRYRATSTLGPNFAYALINERADDIARADWDLSCMRAMDNAAEPIINRTAHRFLELLAPHGLPARAMRPCWGMSETCSGVTYTFLDRDDPAAGAITVDARSLAGHIRAPGPDGTDAVVFTDVGRPIPGLSARIADSSDEVVPECHVGELQVNGDVIMAEYFGNDTANQDSRTADGWFRTGDLAFMHDGSIVITGRVKDQIIVRGVNYLAHELEAAVEEVPGVRVSHVAAAAVTDDRLGPERLALFFVPDDTGPDDWGTMSRLVSDIRQRLVRYIGISPDFVIPLSREEFPKTSSGKVQRGQLAAELHAGTFGDRLNQLTASDHQGPQSTTRAGWLFERTWQPVAETETGASPVDGSWVVFDDEGWWEDVRAALPHPPDQVVRVRRDDTRQMSEVLGSAHDRFGRIGTVLFGWGLGTVADAALDAEPGDNVARAMAGGVGALRLLIQALASGDFGTPALLALTRGGAHVQPGDRVNLAAAPVSGLVRTAVDEAVVPVIRQIDLPDDRRDWPGAIRAELADRSTCGVIARRDGARWSARLRPASQDDSPSRARPGIVTGGCYLMTGGLGGIGYEIAQYLLAVYQVRLLIVGRTPVNPTADSGERAARLADLADFGEVCYTALDIADPQALRAAVDAAEQRWRQPLDGVLHLAGADISDHWDRLEEHRLATETAECFHAMYQAKVLGTLAIGAMLESRPKAAMILFSSVNGDLGGSSFGAYSSANSFLTGFADYWHYQRNRHVRCLAWSMWVDAGMNAGKLAAASQSRGFRPITTSQGIACFLEALSASAHHLLIGLDPENPRMLAEFAAEHLAESEIVLAYTSEQPVPSGDIAAAVRSVRLPDSAPLRICWLPALPRDLDGNIVTSQVLIDTAVPAEPAGQFTEPATPRERQLARIWAEVLNRPRVGRHDSFFELGGNSLRAAQLVARIGSKLEVSVAMRDLYANPTVRELAAVLDGAAPG